MARRSRLPALVAVGAMLVVGAPSAAVAGEGADLALGGSVIPDGSPVGHDETFRFNLLNLGPDAAEDVTLTVDLGPGLVAAPSGPSCSGTDPIVCLLGTVPADTEMDVAVVASIVVAESVEAVGTVASSTSDPDEGNGSATSSAFAAGEDCHQVGTQGADDLEATAATGEVLCGLGGDDMLTGGPGPDTLIGAKGADILEGGLRADVLDAGSGDDTLEGGLGSDDMLGGLGVDLVTFAESSRGVRVDLPAGTATGRGPDTVSGLERVTGSPFADTLIGGSAANTFAGLGGPDSLLGGGGADSLIGGTGADTLSGGPQEDLLVGGLGTDGCVQGVGAGTKTGCEIVAYAQIEGLLVFEPHPGTVGFGFHESLFHSAEILRPLGRLILNDNPGKYPNPPPATDGPGYVVMGSRGRSTPPTAATDIVVPSNATMRAPVTGTVIEVAIYQLYCQQPDWKVIMRPDSHPGLRVLLLHMARPLVEVGDRILAGITPVGVSRQNDPPGAQENDYFPDQYPHVHIEVEHVGAVKGPCGA